MHPGNKQGLPEKEIYIVPGDLELLVSRWIKSTDGKFHRPSSEFFNKITNELLQALEESFEGKVEIIFIPWQKIQQELHKIISEFHKENQLKGLIRPLIVLDPVYAPDLADINFDTTRIETWNDNTNNWHSISRGERPGSASIIEQRQSILNYHGYKNVRSQRRALVLDDVTWKRGTLHSIEEIIRERMYSEKKNHCIVVDSFIVAFEVDTSVLRPEKYPKAPIVSWKKFGGKQIDYYTGDEYFEIVHDIVSERDFFAGVPFSGRTVGFQNKHFMTPDPKFVKMIMDIYKSSAYKSNYGAPYIAPFGLPIKWGSIPAESAMKFSEFCLRAAIKLYSEIEKATQRVTKKKCKITIDDLPRPRYHLVKHRILQDGKDPREEGIIEALEHTIEFLHQCPNSCK